MCNSVTATFWLHIIGLHLTIILLLSPPSMALWKILRGPPKDSQEIFLPRCSKLFANVCNFSLWPHHGATSAPSLGLWQLHMTAVAISSPLWIIWTTSISSLYWLKICNKAVVVMQTRCSLYSLSLLSSGCLQRVFYQGVISDNSHNTRPLSCQ